MIDDLVQVGESRFAVRARLDEHLARPLDEEEAAEYDRDRWGLSDEAMRVAQDDDLWAAFDV